MNGKQLKEGTEDFNEYCIPQYFCEHKEVKWEIDYESSTTLSNWISDFGLLCASSMDIAFAT